MNKTMRREIDTGECFAVDEHGIEILTNEKMSLNILTNSQLYDITNFVLKIGFDNLIAYDFCIIDSEVWIWSIGIHLETQKVYACSTAQLYDNPKFNCLWLR